MSNQNNTQNSGFWFGIIMGSVLGSGALYFLGTDTGRTKLRDILDTLENLDGSVIEELTSMMTEEDENGKKTVPDIHAVLDKIQSSLPAQKQVQKFFVKDGKILK